MFDSTLTLYEVVVLLNLIEPSDTVNVFKLLFWLLLSGLVIFIVYVLVEPSSAVTTMFIALFP